MIQEEDLLRQTGRTIRLADEAVQTLFKEGFVFIRNHCDNRKSHEMLFDLVARRLQQEHPANNFKFSKLSLKIEIIDFGTIYKNRPKLVEVILKLSNDSLRKLLQRKEIKASRIIHQWNNTSN